MNRKIIATLIVLIFCVGCLGIVSAENSTNETAKNNASADMSNYIRPISITDNGIEFSDGFTGFSIDSAKDPITKDDRFISQKTGDDEIQNYVKLAIIEAYKQGCENSLAKIIASFADGSYKNSNDKVIAAVLKSQESVGDKAVVELEDSMEGTFEFELLKDANKNKSDCLAYKVSLKEMKNDTKLGAAADKNTVNKTNDTSDNKNNNTTDNKKTTNSTDNKNNTNTTDNKKTTNSTDNKTNDTKQQTVVNETNKTIVNKTNTTIVNENNTTTINQNNPKVINKTTEPPKNESIPDKIIKTVGNPIFLLVLVIAIAAIVAVVMRRKD